MFFSKRLSMHNLDVTERFLISKNSSSKKNDFFLSEGALLCRGMYAQKLQGRRELATQTEAMTILHILNMLGLAVL